MARRYEFHGLGLPHARATFSVNCNHRTTSLTSIREIAFDCNRKRSPSVCSQLQMEGLCCRAQRRRLAVRTIAPTLGTGCPSKPSDTVLDPKPQAVKNARSQLRAGAGESGRTKVKPIFKTALGATRRSIFGAEQYNASAIRAMTRRLGFLRPRSLVAGSALNTAGSSFDGHRKLRLGHVYNFDSNTANRNSLARTIGDSRPMRLG